MAETAPRPDATGEAQTGRQHRGFGRAEIASTSDNTPSYTQAPRGTYGTYRAMRRNPTIALARMAIHAPIRAGEWSVVTDDDAPREAADLLQSMVVRHRTDILHDALRMLDYGWSSFELVWGIMDNRLVASRYKPLLVDHTKIRVDEQTGEYAGLANRDVELDPEFALTFTHDGEAGDLYGRSLMENVRENAWWPWMELLIREGKFTTRAAGATPIVGYVPGEGRDENGTTQDNSEMAARMIRSMGRGEGVAFPKIFAPWATDLLDRGVDPDKLMAWSIDYLEPKNNHIDGFIAAMKHKEALMLRGMLVPERVVSEGSHGTKAEAEAHASIMLLFAEEVQSNITTTINHQLVDRVMRWNFGESAVGTARIEPSPLVDEKVRIVKEIVSGLLSNPTGVDLLRATLDIDAMYDQLGLPKLDETVQPDEQEQAGVGLAEVSMASVSDIDLTPTQGMRAAARNGLQRHERGESGDGLKSETVRRANRIAQGEALTPDHVIEMSAWFARHGAGGVPDPGTPGYAAWQLWGGDAARRWSNRKAQEVKDARKS